MSWIFTLLQERRSLLALALLTRALFGAADPEQVSSWNFDWDDNIAFMPTRIYLVHKVTHVEMPVSTRDFAEVRHVVGKPGEWEDYRFDNDEKTGSFREFRDTEGNNRFLQDVVKMARTRPFPVWRGPSWFAFAEALSRPETARWTSVITARGHDPKNLLAGVVFLKSEGYVKLLPPEDQLHAVAHPKYHGAAASPSAAKVIVMTSMLDRVQATPMPKDARRLLNAEGTGYEPIHLWGFSDDDFMNYQTAVTELGLQVAKGRWPQVKITVLYTGTRRSGVTPHAVVLMPDGKTRPVRKGELDEAGDLWRHFPRLRNDLAPPFAPPFRLGPWGFPPPVIPRPTAVPGE